MTHVRSHRPFALLAILPALLLTPVQAAPAAPAPCNADRTVSVNGAATVSAQPDYATASFGVSVRSKSSAEALGALKTATLTIRGKLQDAGIASRDIASDDFNIVPYAEQSVSRGAETSELGYATNGRLDVTVRDLKRLSEVIDIAFKAGANTIYGVQLLDSRLRAHRDDARALAVKAAAEKAALLTAASGAAVGCVLRIEEIKTYEQNWWWNPGGNATAQNVVQAAGDDARYTLDETVVAPGSIRVRAEVQITYGLQ